MRRHSADTISLVFGVIFVGIATWWLAGRFVEIRIPNLGWILAAALILAGLVGVAGSLRTDRAAAMAGAPAVGQAYPSAAPAPSAARPDVVEPATSDGPDTEAPTGGPTSDESATDNPIPDEPATDEPATDNPIQDEPATGPTSGG